MNTSPYPSLARRLADHRHDHDLRTSQTLAYTAALAQFPNSRHILASQAHRQDLIWDFEIKAVGIICSPTTKGRRALFGSHYLKLGSVVVLLHRHQHISATP